MKHKRLNLPLVVVAIVTAFSLVVGGLLYYLLGTPPDFKTLSKEPSGQAQPAVPKPQGLSPAEEGFLVLKLRAASELQTASALPLMEGGIDVKGFSASCPGKVVPLNFRAQDMGEGDEAVAALSEVEQVVCLPSILAGAPAPSAAPLAPATLELDDEDKLRFPDAVAAAQARTAVFRTGMGTYVVYAGTVAVSSCGNSCESPQWGVASGISVTKVSRPLESENFLFSVPLNAEERIAVSVTAAAAQ